MRTATGMTAAPRMIPLIGIRIGKINQSRKGCIEKMDDKYKARYEEIYKKIDDTRHAYLTHERIAPLINDRNQYSVGAEYDQMQKKMKQFEKLILGRTSFNELRPVVQELYDSTVPFMKEAKKDIFFAKLFKSGPDEKDRNRAKAGGAAHVIRDMMKFILEGLDHAAKELPPEYMDAEYNDIIKGLGK